jgi:hypothetical protein
MAAYLMHEVARVSLYRNIGLFNDLRVMFRHPEVAAKRPSKDDTERALSLLLGLRASVVTLRGSLRSHLRVTGLGRRTSSIDIASHDVTPHD